MISHRAPVNYFIITDISNTLGLCQGRPWEPQDHTFKKERPIVAEILYLCKAVQNKGQAKYSISQNRMKHPSIYAPEKLKKESSIELK